MEIYERIIELLGECRYEVHRGDEKDYAHLKEGDFSITVINEKGDDDMVIEYSGGEIILLFANEHAHFDPSYDDELYWFIDLAEDIMNDRKCAASLYYNTDDFPKLLSTSFCKRSETKEGPEKIFDLVYRLEDYREKLENNGGKAVFRFWDPSLNFEREIPKKEKNYS
jgi:hypothetical protein